MEAQTIDLGLGESQLFSFSSDLISGNDLPVIVDLANVNTLPTVSGNTPKFCTIYLPPLSIK